MRLSWILRCLYSPDIVISYLTFLMLAIVFGAKGPKTKPFKGSGALMPQEKGEYNGGIKSQ